MTKDELKTILDENNVEYPKSADKKELQKLVDNIADNGSEIEEKPAEEDLEDKSGDEKVINDEEVIDYGSIRGGFRSYKLTNIEDVVINERKMKKISLVNGSQQILSEDELNNILI